MRARQFKRSRRARHIYLVICEGETERVYVEALRGYFRVPVMIKTKVSGNTLTPRLVRQYVAELQVDNDDDYTIFYIYDGDVQVVADRLKSLPGNPILSYPCVEMWFLLHMKEHSRHVDSDEVVRLLRSSDRRWSKYAKGVLDSAQLNILLQNHPDASKRAKRLNKGKNPSSDLHEFIDLLESQKR